jgi:hypothetical protein
MILKLLDLSRVDYPNPEGPPTIDLILIARRK